MREKYTDLTDDFRPYTNYYDQICSVSLIPNQDKSHFCVNHTQPTSFTIANLNPQSEQHPPELNFIFKALIKIKPKCNAK